MTLEHFSFAEPIVHRSSQTHPMEAVDGLSKTMVERGQLLSSHVHKSVMVTVYVRMDRGFQEDGHKPINNPVCDTLNGAEQGKTEEK